LLATLPLACAIPAYAQTSPSIPTREEIQRGVVQPNARPASEALNVESGFERAPCPLAEPQFAATRFTLKNVDFQGANGIDRALLADSFAQYVGKEQSVAIICDIRDRAASSLRAKGYLAAVQVPPQSIKDGVVQLDLLVARISSVQIRGDAGASEKLLARYIDKIASAPYFNAQEAERYLLLMQDIPGLDVRLALRPANGAQGDVIGEFSVIRTPVYADLAVQNLGSRSVGRFGGLAKVGSEGLTIGADFTYSFSQPSIGLNGALESETLVADVNVTYPFVRSQASNVFGTFGLEYINQDVRFGDAPLTEDILSVLYGRFAFSAIHKPSISGRDGEPKWSFSGDVEFRQGLGIFGASDGCGPALVRCLAPNAILPSRIEGDPTAFVVRANGQYEYRPVPELTLAFSPRLQYSPDVLFAYEEISGGNFTVGRGFDPGTIIGDSGISARTELRYGSFIPSGPGKSAFQPFVFFDAALVWNEDTAFNGLDPQELYSIGAGLRANIRNSATLDAAIAVPLNRAGFQTETGDVRFLFTLTMQLSPWNWHGRGP
jgi:hemolysin activation/secretion protein